MKRETARDETLRGSKSRGWISRSHAWLLALVLISPFLILISSLVLSPLLFSDPAQFAKLSLNQFVQVIVRRLSSMELVQVFLFTSLQAFLSAILALLLGVLGAYGLIRAQVFFSERLTPSRARQATLGFEAFALLPNLAPVLLLILAAMKFLPRVNGLWDIVILHSLLNLGLVSVSVVRLIQFRLGRLTELAYLEGVSRFTYFRKALLPILKYDFIALGLFVFTVCFSSFAIPLVIGGSRGVTIEVLIYRALRVDGDMTSALAIAIFQMIAVVGLAVFSPRPSAKGAAAIPTFFHNSFQTSARRLVSASVGLIVLLLPPLMILASLFDGLLDGFHEFMSLTPLHVELSQQLMGSLFVGVSTALLVSVLLMALAWVRPMGGWRKFYLGYAAPSSVLTGLSLLILWRATGLASLIKISIALALIFAPAFYRMQWDALLRGLGPQARTAETLGASRWLIFWEIMMPQLYAPLGSLAGLASLWAWGDFALSAVIAERQLTLAMTAQSLMDSYRLDVATVYIWMIAVGGLISYLFFKGVGRVLGSQSEL